MKSEGTRRSGLLSAVRRVVGRILVPTLACWLAVGIGSRTVEAALLPVLPPCAVPTGTDGIGVTTESGYAFSTMFAQDCVARFTVDLFRPAYDGSAADPYRFDSAPYIDGAAMTANPAAFAYGDGSDRTIILTFEALHTFRMPTYYNPPGFSESMPMIYFRPGYNGYYPTHNVDWALRVRDASGVFGPWQRIFFNSPLHDIFSLSTDRECGGTVPNNIVFDPPPFSCPFTLHWNTPITSDMQIVFPVKYWAVETANYVYFDTTGFTWVTFSVRGVPALAVSLSAGVTNGQYFSVDVTVTNTSPDPMTGVAFTNPDGILPNAAGKISHLTGPSPPLPTTLAGGESVTSTVTFAAEAAGTVDVLSEVSATDGDGVALTKSAQGVVDVGKRRLTDPELQRVLMDGLTDSAHSVGALMNAGQMRLGQITSWAAGPDGADTIPPWLNISVTEEAVPPAGTVFAEPPGWKVSAARALGMDDRAMAWLPDAPATAVEAYLEYSHRFAMAGGKVIDDSGNAAYAGLKEAAAFYGQLSSGSEAFRAAASREFNGLVSDAGASAVDTIAVLGEIIALSHDDPLGGDLHTYENSPALQAFTKKSAEIIDAGLKGSWDETARLVRLAQSNPVSAAGQLGDLVGRTTTTIARDVALAEMGAAGVSRLGAAIERSMPFARTGTSVDGGLMAIDPAAAALTGSVDGTGGVVVRQALESLAEGTTITVGQLEALGGFYAADAAKVQKIITDLNAKYGVNIEIQCRPGNPASLEFYRNGTGVPKPEWVKPKNTDWMDLALGAPPESLGKATVFNPVKPTTETLSKYTQAQRQTIVDRYQTQLDLYEDATTPGGKFAQLLADSLNPEGATVSVGHGTGKRDITGLKYSLRAVGEPGQEAFVVIDDAAGGKFVLSDADYQAAVDANSMGHLPANVRGKLELELMNRLGTDTVSFGGHGWSHSGFDLPSKYSKPFIQFVTEYTSPASARRTLEWFVGKGAAPNWLQEISAGLAVKLGRAPTSAELVEALLDRFRPGSYVIKFNGTDLRVGYGAGIK